MQDLDLRESPKLSPAVPSSPCKCPQCTNCSGTWTRAPTVSYSPICGGRVNCVLNTGLGGAATSHIFTSHRGECHTQPRSGSRDMMSHAATAASPLVTQSHKAETNFGTLCDLSDSRISKFIIIMGGWLCAPRPP